uniref:Protein 4.1 n=1 Tax=Denticeps clupeoides TaxID=299321 RepID=A0AAY4EDM1_9TELE
MTTDEAESQQKRACQQQEEAAPDPGPSDPRDGSPGASSRPPEDEQQLKPRTRTSAGRGLSRLFSSFLKRRSQCSEGEGADTERAREKDEPKAPIADPEPELRIEGDAALDLHSLSSAEIQPVQVEPKEEPSAERDVEAEGGKSKGTAGEDGELEKDEQAEGEVAVEGEGCGEENGVEEEEKEKTAKDEVKPPRAQRRPKIMHCRVTLLDDALYECELDKHAKGQDLFTKVCDHLNLLERDYYGLVISDLPTAKTWLDVTKEIRRQVQGTNYDFHFNVKFYPPDPAQLSEDITRYYLCLQLRKDILGGRLPCSFVTLALLGSYALQSELGEYDPEVHGSDYAKELRLAAGQSRELEDKMVELHRTYRAMTPAQADMMFLENAKKLAMYGVDLHQAKDLDGVDIMLGVCSSGLMVYKDKLRINRFPWPKVLKVSYKRSSFFIKIRPSELEHYESTIGFKLPNYKAAKKLWKVCVEHHTFFRLTSTEAATTPRKFLALGSKFRYSGRTQAQTRQASSMIDRPAPLFQRSASKRASRSLDGVGLLRSGLRHHVSHRWFCTGCDCKSNSKSSKRKNSRGDLTSGHQLLLLSLLPFCCVSQKRAKKVEGETIYIRHSNLMLEDVEKTQTEIMRHHTSISELKRSFMESVPEPRPSEWDKRLSTHSPFRTASINGQLQGGADVVSPAPAPPPETGVWRGGRQVRVRWAPAPGGPPLPGEDEEEDDEYRCGDEELLVQRTLRVSIAVPDEDRGMAPSCRLYPSPLVKTETFTVSDVTNSLRGEIAAKEVPLMHTETKTITYESTQVRGNNIMITSDLSPFLFVSVSVTFGVKQTVKGGISETRIEKRIVITGDTEIDHDKALAQAIREAKEQHPDMSVTKVVVHQETEITPK